MNRKRVTSTTRLHATWYNSMALQSKRLITVWDFFFFSYVVGTSTSHLNVNFSFTKKQNFFFTVTQWPPTHILEFANQMQSKLETFFLVVNSIENVKIKWEKNSKSLTGNCQLFKIFFLFLFLLDLNNFFFLHNFVSIGALNIFCMFQLSIYDRHF